MPNKERIKRCFTAVCMLPWLMILVAYVEAITARLVLALPLLILSVFAAIPLLIVFIVRNWRIVRDDVGYAVRIGTFSAGLLAILLLVLCDPGNILGWLAD